MKRTITDWLKVLLLLLDEAAALLLAVWVLHLLKIQFPLPITIILGLLAGILIFIIHKAIIPSFHRHIITGSEGMIGRQARVVKPLTPVGTVAIDGEHWRAKSIDDNIDTDENVEIVELDQLTLKVKRRNQSDLP